jgi:methyl-accepting chemotaxis protein
MAVALNRTVERVGEAVTRIAGDAAALSTAAERLTGVSRQVSGTAEQVTGQAAAASANAAQVSEDVQAVAAGHDRRADQPARSQRHHRAGPRRRTWQGVRSRRR